MPKQQAKEPIDLDIIVVCRKRSQVELLPVDSDLVAAITRPAQQQVQRLSKARRRLSRNDVRIIVMAQLLKQLSCWTSIETAFDRLDASIEETEALIQRLHDESKGAE